MHHNSTECTKVQKVRNVLLSKSHKVESTVGSAPAVVGRRRRREAAAVPPASNTGALKADLPLSYPDGFAKDPTLDWVSFTIHPQEYERRPFEKPLLPGDDLQFLKNGVIKWLGGGDALPVGLHGYRSAVSVLGTGRVCWHDERPEMGVHVVLPASALQRWSVSSGQTVLDFLYAAASRGAIFRRVDIALDTSEVHMSSVLAAHRLGCTVSKAQKWRVIENESGGTSLYIGSREGRRMVRFYDKAAEQLDKGNVETISTWTRCEVEFKAEHAQTAVDHLLSGADARELILSSIDFRELDNVDTKRRSRCEWWQAWVAVAGRVTFPVRKAAAAVADAMAWVSSQVMPTLAWLCTYMGDTRWLETEVYEAARRVPAWRWDMLPLSMGSLSAMNGGPA